MVTSRQDCRTVYVVGVGQVPVGEHWDKSLRDLAVAALREAVADGGGEAPGALMLGNMLGSTLSEQQHLGALIADWAGFRGIEAASVESACSSGAAALRQGYLAVKSGEHRLVAVLGAEKMTDSVNGLATAGLAMAADAESEAAIGLSFPAINALLMRRYMHEYGPEREDFAAFAMSSHANAVGNPNAMFRKAVSQKACLLAPTIADPVTLMDSAPMADGAAALILADAETAARLGRTGVRIAGSAVATDSLALQDRNELLYLEAVAASTERALAAANRSREDVDFFEVHDAFTIMSILSLEAAGYAPRGEGFRLAQEGVVVRGGRLPICTMGGLKARGHPVGATGVYQAVEAALQLRGAAGDCQVEGARVGLIQNIGGSGATVVTHVLEAE